MPRNILIDPQRTGSGNPNIQFSGSMANTIRLEVLTSGSVQFTGVSGSLLSITDSLSGSLFAVSDVSGLPILETFSDDRVVMGRFGTNALVVTGSNVGIGSSSPEYPLDVAPNTATARIGRSLLGTWPVTNTYALFGNSALDQSTNSGNYAVIQNTGGSTFVNSATGQLLQFRINNTNALVIDSSRNVGVGNTTTISSLFQVYGGDIRLLDAVVNTDATTLKGYSVADGGFWVINSPSGGAGSKITLAASFDWDRGINLLYSPGTTGAAAGVLSIGQQQKNNANWTHGVTRFYTNGTERLRIDSSGNVGINTSPSAWDNNQRVLQVSNGSFYGYSNGTIVAQNLYYNGAWKYIASSIASGYYTAVDGAHQWWIAPAGTAGNNASLTQTMTLNASGFLGIGTAQMDSRLVVNGNSVFSGSVLPDGDLTRDLGSLTKRWANIYANNLSTPSITAQLTGSNLVNGMVLFAGATGGITGSQSQFFWDNTNSRLGVRTSSPSYPLDVSGDAYFRNLVYVGSGQAIRNVGGAGSVYFMDLGRATFRDGTGANLGGILEASSLYVGTSYWGTALSNGNAAFAGNVGIGTTNPDAKLTLSGSSDLATFYNSSGTKRLTIQNSGDLSFNTSTTLGLVWGNASLKFNGQLAGIQVTPFASSYVGFTVSGRAGQTYALQTWQNAAGSILSVVDTNGSVGLGITTVSSPLTTRLIVSGSSTASDQTMLVKAGVASQTGPVLEVENNVGSTLFVVSGSGNVGIGTNNPIRALHVVSTDWNNSTGGGAIFENNNSVGASVTLKPTSSIVSNGTSGWSLYAGGPGAAIGDGNVGLWAHATNQARFVVQRGGNVGIGTATPSILLHADNSSLTTSSAWIIGSIAATTGYTGLKVVNTNTAGRSLIVLGEDSLTAGGTPGAIERYGSTHPTSPNLVNIYSSGPIALLSGPSGIERVRVLAGGTTAFTGSVEPGNDLQHDLGSTSKKWRNVYASNISGSLTGSNLTSGQVLVAGTGGLISGSNNLVWFNANSWLGIGTNSPASQVDLYGVNGGRVQLGYDSPSFGVAIQAASSAWARYYSFQNSSNSILGSFGGYGGANTLTYLFIGAAYDNTALRADPSTGNITIGNASGTGRLYVTGSSASSTPVAVLRAGVASPTARVLDVRNQGDLSVASIDHLGNIYGVTGSYTGDMIISGDLRVLGTSSIINSEVVNIKDNAILLNAGPSPLNFGGVYVADNTANTTGSIIWDASTDRWKAGFVGSEINIVTTGSSDTLRNKTIPISGADPNNISGGTAWGAGFFNGSGNLASTAAGTSGQLLQSNGTSAPTWVSPSSVITTNNIITGSGTTNFVSKFTSGNAIGNSSIFDNGTSVGINQSSPTANARLDVNGSIRVTGNFRRPDDAGVALTVGDGTETHYQATYVYNNAAGSLTFARLNSTGLLIGPTIGAAAATVALDVSGTIRTGGSGLNGRVLFTRSDGQNVGQIFNSGSTGLTLEQGGGGSFISFNVGNGSLNGSNPERMRIDGTTGNVGIGTNSPSYTIDARAPSNADTILRLVKTASTSTTMQAVGGALAFGVDTGAGTTERARIDTNGNVGIGTTTYTARLHVSGSSTATASTLVARSGLFAPSSAILDVQDTIGTSMFWVSGSSGSSNVFIKDNLIMGPGTNRFSLTADSGGNPYYNANSIHFFTISGGATYKMVLNTNGLSINNSATAAGSGMGLVVASGNVGIGTTSTNGSAKLEVNSGGSTAPLVNIYSTQSSYTANLDLATLALGSFETANTGIPVVTFKGVNESNSSSANGALVISTRLTSVVAEKMRINSTGHVTPGTDNSQDLGSTSLRWRNVYATSISGSLTGSNVSAGQVVVAGTGGLISGSNNFWWNNTNSWVGIGNSNPQGVLHAVGAQSIIQSADATYTVWKDGAPTKAWSAGFLSGTDNYQIRHYDGSSWIPRIRIAAAGANEAASQIAIGTSSFTSGRSITTAADVDFYGVRVGRGGGGVSTNIMLASGSNLPTLTGGNNVIIGIDAMRTATSAQECVAVGTDACYGNNNSRVGVGINAAFNAGTNSVCVGSNAGVGLGDDSVSLGAYAGYLGGAATAYVGRSAGIWKGADNTAVGAYALGASPGSAQTTCIRNTAIGRTALGAAINGAEDNAALGYEAGKLLTTGDDNVLLGATAGDSITTGNNNIIIGSGADVLGASNDNSIVIGQGAQGLGTNTTVLGNSSTTTTYIPGSVGISTTAPSSTLQLGEVAVIGQDINSAYHGANFTSVGVNRIKANFAVQTMYDSAAGRITFRRAPAGNAGTSITWSTSMGIDSSGNVGIGVTGVYPAITSRLEVTGSGSGTGATAHFINSSGTSLMFVRDDGNVGVGTTTVLARFHVSGSSVSSDQTMLIRAGTPSQTGPVLEVENNIGSTLLVVSGSGRVGIGTTNPTTLFHVHGGDAWIDRSSGDNSSRALGLTVSTAPAGDFTPGSNPTDSLRTFTVAVKGATRPAILTLRNIDDGANAFYDLVADGLSNKFYIQRADNVPALTIDTLNNIGIGTTSITGRLHVSGSSTGTTTTLLVQHGIANGSSLPVVDVKNSAGTSILYVSGSGNVGIGTTNPLQRLQVGNAVGFPWNATTTPAAISLGSDYSSVAGQNAKLRLFDDGTIFNGFGVSFGQIDYIAASTVSHVWYSGGVERAKITGDGLFAMTGSIEPGGDLQYDLGSTTKRWKNVYATSGSISSFTFAPVSTGTTWSRTYAAGESGRLTATKTINASTNTTFFTVSTANHGGMLFDVGFVVSENGFSVARKYTVAAKFGTGAGDLVTFKTIDTGPYGSTDLTVTFSKSGSAITTCTVSHNHSSAANIAMTIDISAISSGGAPTTVTIF